MRTFQFSDAKSHKFWSIDLQGTSFTVTFGKVGTAGQTQTKSFPTAEKASAEADKLVREKTKKGYRETTATAAPAGPDADAAALEAGILDHPDEVVRWQVYSDYLIERGDPRGEFMRVQLALEDESLSAAEREKLKADEKKLLAAHEREWLGPLAAFTVDAEPVQRYIGRFAGQKLPPVRHAFERGWLARLEFDDLTVNQARAFAASKDARLIRAVMIEGVSTDTPVADATEYDDSTYEPGPDVPADLEDDDTAGLHALCRCPHLAAVRTFQLGEGGDEGQVNCHTPGELAHSLVRQMPRLEVLAVLAHRVDANKLFALPMPRLKSFTFFHNKRYPLDKLAANTTLTELTALRCQPHAIDFDDEGEDGVGAYIRLKHLKAVCRAGQFTKLTHLCLRLTDFGDAGIEEIVSSGVLKRLRVLDLQGGCVSDEGAKMLAACPDVKHLQSLSLRSNALTAAGVTAINATGVPATLDRQHTTTSVTPGADMPEYLFEGDIE